MADCAGTTKKGKPCRATPRHDTGFCNAHSPKETQELAGFGGAQPGAGRPPKPRPDDILRERIEANIDRWLAPLEAALGHGKPVVMWDQAAGAHHVEYVDDPALGMKAMKLAFERVYGKPRQQLELTGEDGAPIQIEHDLTDPKVKEALFDAARAIEARRRDAG